MALETQKALLVSWQARLAAATTNLLDLHSDVTYKSLADVTRPDGLQSNICGQTRILLAPALEGLHELWEQVRLVKAVVDKANELYEEHVGRGLKWFRGGSEQEVAAEIERLLTTDSVTLPPVITPLAQRKLTVAGATVRTISPDALVKIMEESFAAVTGPVTVLRQGQHLTLLPDDEPQFGDEVVGGLITRIGQIWRRRYTTIPRLRRDLAQQKADAMRLSLPVEALEQAEANLSLLADGLTDDPLGAHADIERQVVQVVKATALRLEAMEQARQSLRKLLTSAQGLHQILVQKYHAAVGKFEERQCKIADPNPERFLKPAEASVIDAFAGWMARLEPNALTGRTSAVIGLTKFIEQAKQQIAAAEACIADNEAPIQQRRELQNQFNCLQIKVSAEHMGNFEDVMDASRAAAAALQRPTDLARASVLVDEFRRKI